MTAKLNAMHPAELKAALFGGIETWGEWGSASDHARYARKIEGRGHRMCRCGCRKMVTYTGCCNGVALMSGCELTVARWVRDGYR